WRHLEWTEYGRTRYPVPDGQSGLKQVLRQSADGSPVHKYFPVHGQSNRYAKPQSCLHHLLRYANDASDCSVKSYHPVFCSRYSDLHQYLPAIHLLLTERYLTVLHRNHGWFQHSRAVDDRLQYAG